MSESREDCEDRFLPSFTDGYDRSLNFSETKNTRNDFVLVSFVWDVFGGIMSEIVVLFNTSIVVSTVSEFSRSLAMNLNNFEALSDVLVYNDLPIYREAF